MNGGIWGRAGWPPTQPARPPIPPGMSGQSGDLVFTAPISGSREEIIRLPGGRGQLGRIPDSLGQAQGHGTR